MKLLDGVAVEQDDRLTLQLDIVFSTGEGAAQVLLIGFLTEADIESEFAAVFFQKHFEG